MSHTTNNAALDDHSLRCLECGLDHFQHLAQAIKWHCDHPCPHCNWSLKFKHEDFCVHALNDAVSPENQPSSGEFLKGETTVEFDMVTYAYAYEYVKQMKLPCFWKIEPERVGVRLCINRQGTPDSLFINSALALQQWGDYIKEWCV